jgi:hypothetical protein
MLEEIIRDISGLPAAGVRDDRKSVAVFDGPGRRITGASPARVIDPVNPLRPRKIRAARLRPIISPLSSPL